ncbi:hypothetical protein PIB30_011676 [Stylosanthes scabra]|uniref:Uncharacterized protein n=1 Tax=Stylosanthes scabra TaxID=79078 RepID=A0ABU6X430_9FABA|nr:hypothetical protein [Stylosanthes scabra]
MESLSFEVLYPSSTVPPLTYLQLATPMHLSLNPQLPQSPSLPLFYLLHFLSGWNQSIDPNSSWEKIELFGPRRGDGVAVETVEVKTKLSQRGWRNCRGRVKGPRIWYWRNKNINLRARRKMTGKKRKYIA